MLTDVFLSCRWLTTQPQWPEFIQTYQYIMIADDDVGESNIKSLLVVRRRARVELRSELALVR